MTSTSYTKHWESWAQTGQMIGWGRWSAQNALRSSAMARDGDGIYGPYVRQHLYGGHKEEKYGFFPRQPTCLAKIKDDIFLIWTHGRAKLEAFIQHANTFHLTIKFTSNISTIHVPFLEVMVTLLGNYIHTYFYSKPTDTFNYLHWSSCHPQHTKLSIPYSLAIRLVRVCSSEATLTRRLNDLKHHLKNAVSPTNTFKLPLTKP